MAFAPPDLVGRGAKSWMDEPYGPRVGDGNSRRSLSTADYVRVWSECNELVVPRCSSAESGGRADRL